MDPYEYLGISPDATQEELKIAYRRAAKACHPDSHPDDPGASLRMHEINRAYEEISRQMKRAREEALLRPREEQPSPWEGPEETEKTEENEETEGPEESGDHKDPEPGASPAAPVKRPLWRSLLLACALLSVALLVLLFLPGREPKAPGHGPALSSPLSGVRDLSLLVGDTATFAVSGAPGPLQADCPDFASCRISGNVVSVKGLSPGEGPILLLSGEEGSSPQELASFRVSVQKDVQEISLEKPLRELRLREGQSCILTVLGAKTSLSASQGGVQRLSFRATRTVDGKIRLRLLAEQRGFARLRLLAPETEAVAPSGVLTVDVAVLPPLPEHLPGAPHLRSPLLSHTLEAIHTARSVRFRRQLPLGRLSGFPSSLEGGWP